MNEGARIINDPAGTTPSPMMAGGAALANRPAVCPSCGTNVGQAPAGDARWVYAIGRIDPKFPDVGVVKEFVQLSGGAAVDSGEMVKTDELIEVLSRPDNIYLARQLCWVFLAGDVEVFTLVCQDDTQARRMIEALPSAEKAEQTIQVVVGTVGSLGANSPCAGTGLPAIWIDHQITFTVDEFLDGLAAADRGGGEAKERKSDEKFRAASRHLFARLTRRSNNQGMTDEHRALNYIALRYPAVYRLNADADAEKKALIDVQVHRSPSSNRRLVAVRLIFRSARTDVIERYQCLVDVTDRFPFLAAPLGPVYD